MKRALLALVLLSACDLPGGSDCLPGQDVSGWKVVEVSPDAVVEPVFGCTGKVVGYDVSMPDGDHSSTAWVIEKSMPSLAGEVLKLSVDLASATVPAFRLRPSIADAARVELAFELRQPAGTVRAIVPDRIAPSAGSVRIVQIAFPQTGPYRGRVTNFEW